jgi:hypothetical protein
VQLQPISPSTQEFPFESLQTLFCARQHSTVPLQLYWAETLGEKSDANMDMEKKARINENIFVVILM